AGYFVKHTEAKPNWLQTSDVIEICSVSNCISSPPEGWIEHWLHNELGWFNCVSDAISVVPASQRAKYRLFAYPSLEAAITGAERFSMEQPEPGDYYIVEVLEERGAA